MQEGDPMATATETMGLSYLRAYAECSPKLQAALRDLIEALKDPDTDEDDRRMAERAIREALFPTGYVDLEEEMQRATGEEAEVLVEMDKEEATFAERVADLMSDRGMTQQDLAERIGVGQPAVSMMLKRQARPQRRTVEKVARALGVPTEEIWPTDA
jgi:ribosome-binding protein aMBF1 (putative translation factor)